jgi:hypothetical protein
VVNNQDAVERALDMGHLWALMRSGRYWKLRRNGKTQTWKRDPSRFRILVKFGFSGGGEITQASEIGVANPQDRPAILVSEHDPNSPPPLGRGEKSEH